MAAADSTTYSARFRAIEAILGDYLDTGDWIRTNSESNAFSKRNGLDAFWATRTGEARPGVGICQTDGRQATIDDVRRMVRADVGRTDLSLLNDTAYEPFRDASDEYVAVLGYCSRIVVAVHDCRVDLYGDSTSFALADLTDPALRIAREVGCSPYEDDIPPPELPDQWRDYRWTAHDA